MLRRSFVINAALAFALLANGFPQAQATGIRPEVGQTESAAPRSLRPEQRITSVTVPVVAPGTGLASQSEAAGSASSGAIFLQPDRLPLELAAGGGTYYPAKADFNGDGKLDIVVATAEPGRSGLALFLGRGDGSFQTPYSVTLPSSLAVNYLVARDLDGDSKPDVLVATSAAKLLFYKGNGNGTLAAPIESVLPAIIDGFTLGDLNNDGLPDLVGKNQSSTSIRVLFGNGNGTFGSATSYTVPASAVQVAVGDVTGDGKRDVVVAFLTNGSQNLGVLANTGSGGLSAIALQNTTSLFIDSFYLGFFDGDGALDVLVHSRSCPLPSGGQCIALFKGSGTGTFAIPTWADSMRTEDGAMLTSSDDAMDLNGDGKLDAVFSSFSSISNINTVLTAIGDGQGGFSFTSYVGSPGSSLGQGFQDISKPFGLAVGEFTGDGVLDVVIGGWPDNNQYVAGSTAIITGKSNQPYTLRSPRLQSPPEEGTPSGSNPFLALADVNGDSKLDLLDLSQSGSTLSTRLGDGAGNFGSRLPATGFIGNGSYGYLRVADIDGDGKSDVAFLRKNDGLGVDQVLVGFGVGDGTFALTSFGSGGFSLVLADFNNDGRTDVAVARSGAVDIFTQTAPRTFSLANSLALPVAPNGTYIVAADFNGDGKQDLVLGLQNGVNTYLGVVFGNGNSTFGAAVNSGPLLSSTGFTVRLTVGDLNGDGLQDIVAVQAHTAFTFVNLGSGAFDPRQFFDTFPNIWVLSQLVYDISLVDVDGDGRLDLLATGGNYGVSVWTGNGDGTLNPIPRRHAVGYATVNAMAIGDLNGDGRPDAVVEFGGGLYHSTVLLNDPSRPDLKVVTVSGPASGSGGDTVNVSYSVQNAGTKTAAGVWEDSLWLSKGDHWDSGDLLIATSKATRSASPGQSYQETLSGKLPAATPGSYKLLVRTDSGDQVLESSESNNERAATVQFTVSSPPSVAIGGSADLTVPANSPAGGTLFMVPVPSGPDVVVTIRLTSQAISVPSVSARFGTVPTVDQYDLRSGGAQSEPNGARLVLPNRGAGTWFLFFAAQLAVDVSFHVDVTTPGLSIVRNKPNRFSTALYGSESPIAVPYAITIVGTGFANGATVSLVPKPGWNSGDVGTGTSCDGGQILFPAPTPVQATRVTVFNSTTIVAEFPPVLSIWTYDLTVTSGSQSAIAPGDPFETRRTCYATSNTDDSGFLKVTLSAPPIVRENRESIVTVQWRNTSSFPIVSPLIAVDALNGQIRFPEDVEPLGASALLIASDPNGGGTIPPGATGTIPLSVRPTGLDDVVLSTYVSTGAAGPLSWDQMKASPPPAIDPTAWQLIVDQTSKTIAGGGSPSTAAMAQRFALTGARLAPFGVRTYDAGTLFDFEVAQAGAFGAIAARYSLGAFGRGWPDFTDTHLYINPDGSAELRQSGSTQAWVNVRGVFRPVGAGNNDVLVQNADLTYTVTSPGAGSSFFNAGGVLTKFTDTDNLSTLFGYTSAKLTTITESNGDVTTIAYSGSRVASITDPVGRVTTFGYDASTEHLLSITDPSGTASFTYLAGQGAMREHAVASVKEPNNVVTAFEYDERGRLTKATTGGLDVSTFAYDDFGQITVSDPAGISAVSQIAMFGGNPVPVQLRSGSKAPTTNSFDNRGRLTKVSTPGAGSVSVAYGAFDQPVSVSDLAGETVSGSIDPVLNRLTRFTTPGGSIGFGYNAAGNQTSVSYENGSQEGADYDSRGNVSNARNARQQERSFTYSSKDLVTKISYPDGSRVDYTYDSRRRLTTASVVSGSTKTTTIAYDTADRVTKVTDPNGRFITYGYNADGQLAQTSTSDGAIVKYGYDAAGRLASLLDAGNVELISYAYDAGGRLSTETRSNGTQTTYAYDTAGRLQSLTHTGPGGAALGNFAYQYDAADRPISITTPGGTRNYSYDAAGRLLQPGFSGYDADGNRAGPGISVNNLDQYTQYAGESFLYDPDGNLISRSGGGAYSWDYEGRISKFVKGADTWQYEYDALGNRIATIKNGVRTSYLIDPFGPYGESIVAEYDNGGAKIADYAYGIGLAFRISGGQRRSYLFDGSGNTSLITDPAGTVVAGGSYDIAPFGAVSGGGAANPFTFGGLFGVLDAGDGMISMRARQYDAGLGRFISRDPIGIAGGSNLYAYSENAPIMSSDPSGLIADDLEFIANAKRLLDFAAGTNDPILREQYLQAASQHVRDAQRVASGANKSRFGKTVVDASKRELRSQGERRLTNTAAKKTVSRGIAKAAVRKAATRTLARFTLRALGAAGLALEVGLVATDVYVWNEGRKHNNYLIDNRGERYIKLVNYFGGRDDPEFWKVMGDNIRRLRVGKAIDPNDIIGPTGAGPAPEAGYFGALERGRDLLYLINFENKPSATLPAQVVTVTQQLDSNLDWSSVRFGDYGFGNIMIRNADGTNSLGGTVQMNATLAVRVTASIDTSTGVLTWVFRSIDPVTNDEPTDPLAGFLPPNTSSPNGQGWVAYMVKAKTDLVSDTRINAQARVYFDDNAPLDTPSIYNTIGGTVYVPIATQTYNGGW